jgi:hypothetical protein
MAIICVVQGNELSHIFSQLSLGEVKQPLAGKFSVARMPGMSDTLFALKKKIHSLLIERHFIQSLECVTKLQKTFELREFLKKKDFKFLYDGTTYSISLPVLSDSVPLPLVTTICRMARFTATLTQFRTYETMDRQFAYFVDKLSLFWKENPTYHEHVGPFVEHMRYAQLKCEFQRSWDEIKPQFSAAETYADIRQEETPYLKRLIDLHTQHRKSLAAIANEAQLSANSTNNSIELQKTFSDRDAEEQKKYAESVKKVLSLYENNISQIFNEYEKTYTDLRSLLQHEIRSRSITKICTEQERSNPKFFYLHPTEFVMKRNPCNFFTYADEICEKLNGSQKKLSSPKKKKVVSSPQKTISTTHPAPLTATQNVTPVPQAPLSLIEDTAPQHTEIEAAHPAQVIVKKKKQKEKKEPTPISTKISFPIKVGDGPNPALEYTWHIRRWERDSGFDPITDDPNYSCYTYSPEKAFLLRVRHTFGRALDNVLLNVTTPFMVKSPTGIVVRKNYCLPGDIFLPDGSSLRGIFRITLGIDQKIIHKFFTTMTSNELIQKYQQEGSFRSDPTTTELEEPLLPTPNHKEYALPDDGSRISSVSPDFITTQCTDGIRLNVVPFPDA